MLRDALVSLLLAIPMGMGVGGGGLPVLYLTMVMGLPQAEAQGINLLFFLSAAIGSLSVGLRRRRIRELPLLLTIAGGILLALPGAWLAMRLDAALLRRAFGGLMLLSGLVALFGRRHKNM